MEMPTWFRKSPKSNWQILSFIWKHISVCYLYLLSVSIKNSQHATILTLCILTYWYSMWHFFQGVYIWIFQNFVTYVACLSWLCREHILDFLRVDYASVGEMSVSCSGMFDRCSFLWIRSVISPNLIWGHRERKTDFHFPEMQTIASIRWQSVPFAAKIRLRPIGKCNFRQTLPRLFISASNQWFAKMMMNRNG